MIVMYHSGPRSSAGERGRKMMNIILSLWNVGNTTTQPEAFLSKEEGGRKRNNDPAGRAAEASNLPIDPTRKPRGRKRGQGESKESSRKRRLSTRRVRRK